MRSLIRRAIAVTLAVSGSLAQQAHAQDATPAVVASTVVIGFLATGVAATARLVESPQALNAGDSVRFVLRRGGSAMVRVGRARALTRDSLTFTSFDSTIVVSRGEMQHVRAYRGTEHKWAQGWFVGFVTGASIGAWSGYSSGGASSDCEILCFTQTQSAILAGSVGAISGSLLGAGLGALVDGAHWRSVNRLEPSSDPRHAALSPVVGPRRLGARIDIPVR